MILISGNNIINLDIEDEAEFVNLTYNEYPICELSSTNSTIFPFINIPFAENPEWEKYKGFKLDSINIEQKWHECKIGYFDFIQKQVVSSGDDNEPVKISIGENEFEVSPMTAMKISGIACAILVVPVLLLLMLLPKTAQNAAARVSEINKKIETIDGEIQKISNMNNSNKFNEQATIKATLENNKTKLMSYSALGASVPQTLWITYFSAKNNGQIDIQGQAESVEDVYAFFRNMKDSLINSNLRLHKLELASNNVDDLVESDILSQGYDFEITNMSEEELGSAEELSGDDAGNKSVSGNSKPPKNQPGQKSSRSGKKYAKEITGK